MLRQAWEKLPLGLREALWAYLCFRAPLEAVLAWSAPHAPGEAALGWVLPQGPGALGMPPLDGPMWLHPFLRWDSGWYVRIIHEGYSYSACVAEGDPCQQASVAFFPLFPKFATALVWAGLPLTVSTFLVTHLSLIFALWGLHRLAGRLIPNDAGATGRVMVALLAFPSSIFLSAAYSESVLIAFAVWALVFFEEDRPIFTGLCLALAVLARSHGALLAAALGAGAAWRRNWKLALACAVLPGVALGGYMAWLGSTFGDPIAFVHARKAWGYTGDAGYHIKRYWAETLSGSLSLEGWLDFVAAAWLAVAGVLSWRRFGPAHGLYVLAIVLLPLREGQIWALARISLCAIPCYLLLAEWTARPRLRALLFGAGMAMLAVSGVRFVNGWHTGS